MLSVVKGAAHDYQHANEPQTQKKNNNVLIVAKISEDCAWSIPKNVGNICVSKGTTFRDGTVPDTNTNVYFDAKSGQIKFYVTCWFHTLFYLFSLCDFIPLAAAAVAKLWMFEWDEALFLFFFDEPTPLGGGLWGEASGWWPPLWIMSDMHVWVSRVQTQQKGVSFSSLSFSAFVCLHRFMSFSGQQASSSEPGAASIQVQLIKTMAEVNQWLYVVYRWTSSRVYHTHTASSKCFEILGAS